MKRLLLVISIAGPLAAQWTVWDPTNYGINYGNLQQAISDSEKAVQYYQMARNAAAFVHDPAAFLAQTAAIAGVAINDAASAGWTTQKRAAQLQARLRMGQVLMNESGSITALSHGNASSVQGIAVMMQSTAEQLSRLNAQMQHEQRSKYYTDRNQYQDQGSVISGWRLK
jgi:hypothetical protein